MLHLARSHAEGARIERAPGFRPDLGLATRCLHHSASPPRAPGRNRTCTSLPGHASLSRACLPFPPQGPVSIAARQGFEPRSPDSESGVLPTGPTGTALPVQDSNLALRSQNPPCCRMHQPGPSSLSRDSNPEPPVYETGARPVELKRHCCIRTSSDARESNAVCPDPKSGGLPSPSHPSAADQGLEPCPPW